MTEPECCLEEYVEHAKEEIDRFAKYWMAMQAVHGTENYPTKMQVGDWAEQFLYANVDDIGRL